MLLYKGAKCTPISRRSDRLLEAFSMQGYIQPLAFLFLGNAQPNGHIDDLQDHPARNKTVHDGKGHAFELNQHRTVKPADLLAGKKAGEQRADDPADAVYAERVQ